LRPEHPFPAAIDDVCAAWRALRAGADPDARLTVAGDSAGGNLALALMLVLRDARERLPDAAALFSPGTDLTGASPSLDENAARDVLFDRAAIEQVVATYLAGADPNQPLASPLFGDLRGLPPLLVHVGADELLRDDAVRLAEKARAAGVAVELKVWPVVPHVWQMMIHLPEARRSVAAAVRFLREASVDDDGGREVAPAPAASSAAASSTRAAARRHRAPPVRTRRSHHDVIIVGAGLSGVGAAAHLQDRCPHRSVAIFEARDAIGGTWDLFRYPGIRSDSDMYTLGYEFKPWADAKAIADGSTIRRYIVETAARARHRPPGPLRSPRRQRRLVVGRRALDRRGRARRPARAPRCGFLLFCSGYYRYDARLPAGLRRRSGLSRPRRPSAVLARRPRPRRPARRRDRQRRDRDHAGAGDGEDRRPRDDAAALAELHRRAAVAGPDRRMAEAAPAGAPRLPLVRFKNVLITMLFFNLARRWPDRIKARLIGEAARRLGPATTSRPTSRRATTRGTSASASRRTPTCSARSSAAARRSSPIRSTASPSTASASRRVARSRPTSSSPRPG
jgi:hypothetical protein